MNDLSHKMQPPQGEDVGQEAQQQGESVGTYQQGLPPVQGSYPQYTPPGGYQQYGYQPYPPEQQQSYGSQQQQQYAPQYAGGAGPYERTSLGIRARTAGLLCYLFGWVSGLIFFLLEKENRFVRFHALQSILFFGILTILGWVFGHLPLLGVLGGVIGLVMFIGWIVMMVKAYRGEYYKIPFFGDLAERLMGQIKV